MKHAKENVGKTLDRLLGRYDGPSSDRMQAAIGRVGERLSSGIDDAPAEALSNSDSIPRFRRWPRVVVAIAAVTVVAIVLAVVSRSSPFAVVEASDGVLQRTSGEKSETIQAGAPLETGEIVRSGAGQGAVLAISDGSQIEMRAQSELSLERADDGVRIHLSNGGVIVNAAKQGRGNLYVQTKDMVVSVAGTVFLVNAEEEGSRVAVIQGKADVQQGAVSMKLMSGEQVSTNPLLESQPVSEEIAWSRSAPAHQAMWQMSAPRPVSPAVPQERTAFEAISIRPSTALSAATIGRGRGDGQCNPQAIDVQLNPGRFAMTCATLHNLVDLAYGVKNCSYTRGRGQTFVRSCVSGGPDWSTSDGFDVQAVIPAGSPIYTRSDLMRGEAPKLQMMIQALLADRFKLVLHREAKEIPAYNLVIAKEGILKLSGNQTPADPSAPGSVDRGDMSRLIESIQWQMDRLIIDKTDLKGVFDISTGSIQTSRFDPSAPIGPQIVPIMLERLGLKLESTKVRGEVLVIDRVEKPSEN